MFFHHRVTIVCELSFILSLMLLIYFSLQDFAGKTPDADLHKSTIQQSEHTVFKKKETLNLNPT